MRVKDRTNDYILGQNAKSQNALVIILKERQQGVWKNLVLLFSGSIEQKQSIMT